MRSLLGVSLLMLGAGCAMNEATVMMSPHRNWLAVGYDQDRSYAIQKTQKTAQRHCREQGHKQLQLMSEVTVYQGRVPEEVNAASQAAGDVARIYGDVEGSRAGRVFASDTDYKTTIEFRCE